MPLTEEEKKQKNREKYREYYQKNKEKINKWYKEYRNTDKGIKSRFKKKWKLRGVKFTDEEFESIWKEYTTQTHCEFCYTELNKNDYRTKKCLDHDHETGQFRFILCFYCNITRQSD